MSASGSLSRGSELDPGASVVGRPLLTSIGNEAAPFILATEFHANARRCRVTSVGMDFEPMAGVARACAAIFGAVDREDAVQRFAASDVWRLKASLMLTALSFDDSRLGLREIVTKLEKMSESIPSIQGPVAALAGIVATLLSGASNPKRQRVLELLQSPAGDSAPVALVANLFGSNTPGWPATLDITTDFGSASNTLVRARKEVRSSCFSRVIFPGSPKFAPRGLVFDLLYGGRTADAVVLSYRAERAEVPRPVAMPKCSFFTSAGAAPTVALDATESSDNLQLDQWAYDSFWESIRARHADAAPVSDRDVSVGARFVLFADGSGAFLPEDGSVVEISDRFDRGIELDTAEERLPRKAVRDLEEGDLAMMRLSGSGDYLGDVADSLMAQAGEPDLRARALQWKDRLQEVMKRHGEGMVARRLRELGIPLRSAQYLWAWAGDAVMAPHDLKTFRALIAAVWHFDIEAAHADAEAYADARWQEMEHVKMYHHRAGAEIRAALLTRVHALIVERKRIETVQSIELPGVNAGRMGLLRVSAIDGKSMRIPMSRLFHLEHVSAT